LLLDLSTTQGAVSDPCNLSAVALPAPVTYSDVEAGYFNGGSISGGRTIAEQVAAYSPGGGRAALGAAKAAFLDCGFRMAPGAQPNVIDFRGTAPNLNPGEWIVANARDVLIEVGIDDSDKQVILRNLLDAISDNVSRLRHT
jgi:hypothetical protein